MTAPRAPRLPPVLLFALVFLTPLVHVAGVADPFGLPKSTLLAGVALALLADAAVRALRGRTPMRAPRAATIPAALFLVAAAAATLQAPNRWLALRGLADLGSLMVIAWSTSRVARDPGRAPALFRAVLASATLLAVGTLAQIFRPGFHLQAGGLSILPPSPAGATLGDPGLAAQWLVLSLPFGIAAAAASRGVIRLLAGAALGLVGGALAFIGRPEGWIAAALVLAAVVATRMVRAHRGGGGWGDLTPDVDGTSLRAGVVAVLVALLVVAAARLPGPATPITPPARVGLLAPTTGDPAADRAAGVRGTLALIALHPLGVGPAVWRHAFLEVAWTRVPASPFSLGHQAIHAGNSLLELAAETGVAGGLLFTALVAVALLAAGRAAFPRAGAGRDPPDLMRSKAAFDTLLAVAVVAALGSCFQEVSPALLVFVALGLALPATAAPGPARRRAPAALAGLALVAALAAVAAPAAMRRHDASRATFAGQSLLGAGDAAAAIRVLDRPAVAASPEHLPHALLANAALRLGLHEKAVGHFGAVLDRSPWFIAARLGRAAAWEGLGRYDRAEEDLGAALALWPGNPDTALALGRLNARRGRFDQALGDLRRAVELDRSRAEPWLAIGEIEARLGRPEEAITAFRLAAERNPRHPRVNVLIGDAYEKKGLLEMAVAFFQKAAAVDPLGVEPRLRLANALHAIGRNCEARATLEGARDLETDAARRETLFGLIDRLEPECRRERARAGG